jgi:hypothetical protein
LSRMHGNRERVLLARRGTGSVGRTPARAELLAPPGLIRSGLVRLLMLLYFPLCGSTQRQLGRYARSGPGRACADPRAISRGFARHGVLPREEHGFGSGNRVPPTASEP